MMPLTEVQSSTIKAVGYDMNALLVVFHSSPDRVYAYNACDQEDAKALLTAPSVGKHFAEYIKGLSFTILPLAELESSQEPPRPTVDPFDWFAIAKAAGAFIAPRFGLFF